MQSRWSFAPQVSEKQLSQFPEMHPLIVQLLHIRGIDTQEGIERFLTPDYSRDIHDPFLFRDMHKAVERVDQARKKKEKVVVFGDYDADGVCAAALLVDVLAKIGIKSHVHLPHREKDGYGLNPHAVKEFIDKQCNLVITCDCGITSVELIKDLKNHGIDTIVTDHHLQARKLPEAFAILNPHLKGEAYPFKDLVGTGVAFKFAQAILSTFGKSSRERPSGEEKWLLDLVAIATIADYGPLIDENRTLTKFGLIVTEKTKRVGLASLLDYIKIGKNGLTSEMVAFQIVPRLNAASRMDHANTAYKLLQEQFPDQALVLADTLNALNGERQKISEAMFKEATRQSEDQKQDHLLAAFGSHWQAGVLGLVAGRLLHATHKPSLVLTENEGAIVGSGRSIPEYDITAALNKASRFLEKFGGHPQACGFTIKEGKKDAFIRFMKKDAKAIPASELSPSILCDTKVRLEDITWELWDDLQHFEPFGEGNPQPIFCSEGVSVDSVTRVGGKGQHIQLRVRGKDGIVRKTIGFGMAERWAEKLMTKKRIDIAYQVSVNEWNGSRELQLKLVDIHQ